MYITERYSPNTESDLLKKLSESVIGKNKVVIVGGHYMLLYDKATDALRPVISQELDTEGQKKFAEQNAGNFPVRSFRYSLELYKIFQGRKVESGLVLLINDHKFQSSNFQPDVVATVNGRGGELRKNYFNKNIIPGCYAEILELEKVSKEIFLIDNSNNQRQSSDLLPKQSWFYSEQKLRNRFDDFIKPELMKKGNIRQDVIGNKVELYFESPNHSNDFCLTESGSCACSAEVIEFISNLLNRGMNEIIFFVPNECAVPVDNGVMAALNIRAKQGKVLTVSNFGGMGFNENIKRPFAVTEHIFE